MNPMFEELIKKTKKALVIGIGGGGDVLGAMPTFKLLESRGVKTELAGLTYERSKFDPVPGPRPFEQIENLKKINNVVGLASHNTKTPDGVIFQASKIAKALDRDVFIIDITKGVKGVVEGLNDLIKQFSFDLIIGIDVGGDVLASGFERGLRSPLTDGLMLSALNQIEGNAVIGVYGIGCDGELKFNEISRYLS
ncbi:MAG: DUF1152 domain-containing protein, partial [Candidatus Odinarchaeia archaeon]